MRGSAFINEENLEEALRKAFRQFQKQGLMLDAKEDDIVNGIMNNIKSGNNNMVQELNMTGNNKAFTNALNFLLMNEYLGKNNPAMKLDASILFKDMSKLSPDQKKDLKDELEKILELKLKEMNKLLPKNQQKSDKDLKLTAAILADTMVNAQDELIKDKDKTQFLANLLALKPKPESKEKDVELQMDPKEVSYRSQFGGEDPSQAGGEKMIVERVEENFVSFLNAAQGLATSFAAADERNRYDSSVPDYTGDEFQTLSNQMATGAVTESVERELINDGVLKGMTPQNTMSPNK